jgi:hypothetical protein
MEGFESTAEEWPSAEEKAKNVAQAIALRSAIIATRSPIAEPVGEVPAHTELDDLGGIASTVVYRIGSDGSSHGCPSEEGRARASRRLPTLTSDRQCTRTREVPQKHRLRGRLLRVPEALGRRFGGTKLFYPRCLYGLQRNLGDFVLESASRLRGRSGPLESFGKDCFTNKNRPHIGTLWVSAARLFVLLNN